MRGLSFSSVAFLFRTRLFCSISVFASILVFGLDTASAQSSLRKYVYGNNPTAEKKKPAPPKKAAPPKRPPVKPVAATKKTVTNKSKKRTTAGRASQRRPGWITVNFESKEPNTQIFLNGNLVGTTNETRKFQKTITPGIYRVKGLLGANVIFGERLVQLGADAMSIPLYEEVAKRLPEKVEVPLVIPKTPAEIEMELAREMSARVIKIFSDYIDPQKSSEVTTENWKFAANAAVLGEFQNLSKQQIEAQRKFAAGQVALAEGNRQKAFADFTLAIQSFSSSPLPHIGLGDAYFASAQWQDARRSFEQARTVGPNFWMAHLRLGDIYRILGDKKKAALSYADAVKFGDARYETRFLRTRALVDAEEAEAAIPLLEELLKEKTNSMVYLALGEAYEMLKRDVAALDNYRKAVDMDPTLPVAQYRLARIYFEQREYKKAVEGFDNALKLDGDRKSFSHEDARTKRSNASSRIRTVSR